LRNASAADGFHLGARLSWVHFARYGYSL
jgi:hypothetical protein